MFKKSSKLFVALTLGAALTAMHVGGASAAVVINFVELPNESGIHASGNNGAGGTFDVTKLGSESFHLSSPSIPTGYAADATLGRIGISRTADQFLVNILEGVGGPLSDQVWVHRLNNIFTVIDFISDPDQFVTGVSPFATIIETGELQQALVYTNDQGDQVTINILSDAAEVPEPGSLALIGLGLTGLVVSRRRRSA